MGKKEYYTAEGIDKKIVLTIMGSEVENRVWCVGYMRNDKTHRIREVDGFYDLTNLQPTN